MLARDVGQGGRIDRRELQALHRFTCALGNGKRISRCRCGGIAEAENQSSAQKKPEHKLESNCPEHAAPPLGGIEHQAEPGFKQTIVASAQCCTHLGEFALAAC